MIPYSVPIQQTLSEVTSLIFPNVKNSLINKMARQGLLKLWISDVEDNYEVVKVRVYIFPIVS